LEVHGNKKKNKKNKNRKVKDRPKQDFVCVCEPFFWGCDPSGENRGRRRR
jgi:hypothetical protein